MYFECRDYELDNFTMGSRKHLLIKWLLNVFSRNYFGEILNERLPSVLFENYLTFDIAWKKETKNDASKRE